MKKLLKYLKGYEKECVLGPLFKLLEATFELLVPLVVASIVDKGIGSGDRGYPFLMMILAEVPIFIAEAVVCAMKLKGHTRGRRVSYALCANAVSLAFGLWANPHIFRLLQQL